MFKSPLAVIVAGLMSAAPAVAQTLPSDVQTAMAAALQDERHAQAFYAAVITKFGDARPFSNIIKAERQHESMVIDLYTAYGLAVPENGYATGALAAPEAPETLAEACRIGVEAEILNRDLYDAQLLPVVAAYPDITRVMQALRDASEEKHLPAFQRCAGRG
jgi:hypothetical protein